MSDKQACRYLSFSFYGALREREICKKHLEQSRMTMIEKFGGEFE